MGAWAEDSFGNPQGVPKDLVDLALQVLLRIEGEDSELQELWDEGGRNETWHSEMADLKRRVGT